MNKTRKDFFVTKEGESIRQKLQQMVNDRNYNTSPSYSSNTAMYPDSLIPFVDKHMNYLINHPQIEATKYLANIKLITRLSK